MRGLVLAMLVFVAGCPEEKSEPAAPAPQVADRRVPDGGTKRQAPVTQQAQAAVKEATAHAVRLKQSVEAGKPDRAKYRALRRQVFASKPFFQLRAQMGSEVLVGPLRSVSEAGGALGMLDAALATDDLEAASKELDQVIRALRLIDQELAINEIPPDEAAEAISDAAYELGLMLMEAYPGVPDRGEAVLADMVGTTRAIVDGAAALSKLARTSSAAKKPHETLRYQARAFETRLSANESSHELTGRAELVRRTGTLGVLARQFAKAAGYEVKLPYEARFPQKGNALDEPIHAFILPAPRRDLRKGDRAGMVALGRQLFADKRLSQGGARACIDCHQPAKAYTDGRPTPASLSGEPITRNTPTLLYTSIHAAQLWDGLFASAEDQAIKVIHTASEMGLRKGQLVATLKADEGYAAKFDEVFADGLTADNVGRALVAFEIDRFVPGQAPLDRFARGQNEALTATMSAGLDVFGGVGRCGRCHIPPLFGGSRPPDFSVPVFANLGVLKRPKGAQLDDDPGRGKVTKSPLDAHAFKTPTVRNAHLTAPFMHHGAYATLEQVVDFYDVGGGRGRGVDVPNQDPDVRKLELGDERKAALLAFVRDGLADPDMPEP